MASTSFDCPPGVRLTSKLRAPVVVSCAGTLGPVEVEARWMRSVFCRLEIMPSKGSLRCLHQGSSWGENREIFVGPLHAFHKNTIRDSKYPGMVVEKFYMAFRALPRTTRVRWKISLRALPMIPTEYVKDIVDIQCIHTYVSPWLGSCRRPECLYKGPRIKISRIYRGMSQDPLF